MLKTVSHLLVLCGVCLALVSSRPSAADTLIITDANPASAASPQMAPQNTPQNQGKYQVKSTVTLPTGKGYRQDIIDSERERTCMRMGTMPSPLMISQGDMISEKLRNWAMGYGYELVWDASELQSQGRMTSEKGFSETLLDLKKAMEMNGIDLDITTYTNCVVRVVETQE